MREIFDENDLDQTWVTYFGALDHKLIEKYKAEDIIANPEKHSEAVVVNAWRHLYGVGGVYEEV